MLDSKAGNLYVVCMNLSNLAVPSIYTINLDSGEYSAANLTDQHPIAMVRLHHTTTQRETNLSLLGA